MKKFEITYSNVISLEVKIINVIAENKGNAIRIFYSNNNKLINKGCSIEKVKQIDLNSTKQNVLELSE